MFFAEYFYVDGYISSHYCLLELCGWVETKRGLRFTEMGLEVSEEEFIAYSVNNRLGVWEIND